MSDYSFCDVCRINHNEGRRHKYSKRHGKLLDDVLRRFSKKIQRCCKEMTEPVIIDGEYDPKGSFWCHFCKSNIMKHVTDRELTIQNGGVFEHLSSKEHNEKLKLFWTSHCTDEKLRSCFVITTESFTRYKEMVEKKLEGHVAGQVEERSKTVQDLKSQEKKRLELLSQHVKSTEVCQTQQNKTVRNQHGVIQNPTGWHDSVRVWGGGIVKYPKGSNQWIPWEMDLYKSSRLGVACRKPVLSKDRYTVRAEGHGLTAISLAEGKATNAGNVHSGSVPPWLMNDSVERDESGPQVSIGPSEELFRAHVERKRKRKDLKSKKVGANFDHSQSTSADWLPSFGRVWNSGPRWQSRRQFRQELKGRKQDFSER